MTAKISISAVWRCDAIGCDDASLAKLRILSLHLYFVLKFNLNQVIQIICPLKLKWMKFHLRAANNKVSMKSVDES